MEQPKKERSLHMLTLLMQPNKRYSVNDLTKLLNVDRRTIYRYVSTFNEAGFVVHTDHHHVRLEQNTAIHKQLSDLLYFNQEEAVTLYNAIDSIETNTVFRAELKRKLASIYGSKAVEEKLVRLEKNQVKRNLLEAIKERKQVTLVNYSSPSSNTQKDRLVEPFALSDGDKQVWAYEIESKTNKVFSLSRIESVKKGDSLWKFSRHHKQGFTDAFRMISLDGNTLPVRLRLSRRAYNLLIEEHPLAENDIQYDEKTGEWIYDAQVSNYKGVGRFILGLVDCLKIETPQLKKYIIHYAKEHILCPEMLRL